jgi:hypothetical protein
MRALGWEKQGVGWGGAYSLGPDLGDLSGWPYSHQIPMSPTGAILCP